MHNFVAHFNESACRKSGRLGMEQVVIDLIIFYDNRKLLTFKVLGIVVYFFLEKYICVEVLYLQK